MSLDSIKILALALNNMKLDELIQNDRSNGSNNPDVQRELGAGQDKSTGLNSPFMTINGYSVSKFLDSFSLDLNGFLPVIRFSFTPLETVFISVNYPKDGDIVSAYMRSPGDFWMTSSIGRLPPVNTTAAESVDTAALAAATPAMACAFCSALIPSESSIFILSSLILNDII